MSNSAHKPTRHSSGYQISGKDIILMSCFDGIGTSALVLKDLYGPLALFVAWEIDPECILVTQRHHPEVHARGDFDDENIEELIKLVLQVDPDCEKIIILTGAPPCPDFSVIRPDAPGRSGHEGQKFSRFSTFMKKIEQSLPKHRVAPLIENVLLQDRGEIDFFSKALDAHPVPDGPLVLRHHALSFGAVASVWGFNRCADSICFLARRLLQLCVGHFVDDFVGIECDRSVPSGFTAFASVFRHLGLAMKERKALSPAPKQKILGIVLEVCDDSIILAPHPPRVLRLSRALRQVLHDKKLSAVEAQRLAGKMQFLSTSIFGQLGCAALHPLYARAHGLGNQTSANELNDTLVSSIETLIQLLEHLQPRHIPVLHGPSPTAVIYTDAFFEAGDLHQRVGHTSIDGKWSMKNCPNYKNGWGFLCLLPDGTSWYAAGQVPAFVLQAFCRRRAFIYFLEVAAQLFTFLVMRARLPLLMIALIDNRAGLAALTKGYGKDVNINNLLAVTWRLIAHFGWNIHFEWVRSELNLGDAVSRFEFSEAIDLGAQRVDLRFNELFGILVRVAKDSTYAHGEALDDLLGLDLSSLPTITSSSWATSSLHCQGGGCRASAVVECPADISRRGAGEQAEEHLDMPAEANEASEEELEEPKEPLEDAANHSDEDKTRGKVRVSKAERRRCGGRDFLGGC
eukprot:Skav210188  [mRNA]  locus=scaffold2101:315256:320021:- [translate_table: standard]